MSNQKLWKPITGYDDFYEVSNQGDVRNIVTGKLRTPTPNHHGYLALQLKRGGTRKHYFVHRLVAAAFIGPLPDGMQVNHKDGNKANNRVENLEYASASDNISHAWQELGFAPKRHSGESNANSRLTADQVKAMRADWSTGNFSYGALAQKYRADRRTITRIIKRETWGHIE